MSAVISKECALEIVAQFRDEILALDADGILAIHLIGSLGGGYYRPGQSDIDTVVLTKDHSVLTQEQMDEIGDRYQKRYDVPKGFGAVLIYEHELFPPYLKSKAEEFEFSVEIARLKTQGTLFYGEYDLSAVPMPTKEHLIEDAIIMEKWFNETFGYPMYRNMNITACVNSILWIMRRYLMIEHAVFAFNKFELVDTYLTHNPAVVDKQVFRFIQDYLHGQAEETEQNLIMLRDFGKTISDYYNEKLLGAKYFTK